MGIRTLHGPDGSLGAVKDVKIVMKQAINYLDKGKNYADYESELDLNLESCYRVLDWFSPNGLLISKYQFDEFFQSFTQL